MEIKLTDKDRVDYIPDDELFCDVCGMTYKEFMETGRFGCENCYRVFKSRTVKKIKDSIEHDLIMNNKTVENTNNFVIQDDKEKSKRIKELKELLAMCIKLDEKDKASIIEKEIKRLEEMDIQK